MGYRLQLLKYAKGYQLQLKYAKGYRLQLKHVKGIDYNLSMLRLSITT